MILKKVLILYFIIHVIFMLIVGFTSFTDFKDKETYNKLNSVGQIIVEYSDLFQCSKPLTDFIFFYSIYTGTNRGYAFFSPNISPTKVNISFVADGKEIKLPFITQESKLKFGCANLHFNSNIFDIDEREIILKSISSYLFSNNPNIDKLDIYLKLKHFMDLETVRNLGYKVHHKSILGFSATKQINK